MLDGNYYKILALIRPVHKNLLYERKFTANSKLRNIKKYHHWIKLMV